MTKFQSFIDLKSNNLMAYLYLSLSPKFPYSDNVIRNNSQLAVIILAPA